MIFQSIAGKKVQTCNIQKTHSDIIILNDSCHPHEHKISSINYLVNRSDRYPISKEAKQNELNIIKNTLHSNNYNINTVIKHPATQKQNTDIGSQR
jgi:hypothetical protein